MSPTAANPPVPEESKASVEYCNIKWKEAMIACERNLNAKEREHLSMIKTYEDFKQNVLSIESSVTQKSGSGLIQRLGPIVDPLFSLTTLLAAIITAQPVEVAMVWGLMSVLIRSASKTDTLLPETIKMLQSLGHDLEIFQLHGQTFANNPRIGDELMDIFVDIIMFWARTVPVLNRNKHSSVAQQSWPALQGKFDDSLKQIRARAEQIKEKADAIALTQQFSQASLLTEIDRFGKASVNSSETNQKDSGTTCCNIPFSRNVHFFGREEELAEISKALGDDPSDRSFHSYALYGTGGIGKTQLALAYAYSQKDAGTHFILWINCETGLSILRSFSDVANSLQLKGAMEDELSEQNKLIVLRWLRQTEKNWLIIYDNVDDLEIFRDAWPVADSGKVLITSRNDTVSFDPAAGGLEIQPFEAKSGGDLILKHVGRSNYSEEETQAAFKLSHRLDGLALALVVMSSQVRLRRMSIKAFLQLYEKHSKKLSNETRGVESYYKLSLATCWQTAFNNLTPDAKILLTIIANLGADCIPEELFTSVDEELLPQEIKFCADEWSFSEAAEHLLSASLVRKNPIDGVFSVHRLIQEEYRNFIDKNTQHRCLLAASTLLYAVFPKQEFGQAMRLKWAECKKYISHVLMLFVRCREFGLPNKTSSEIDQLVLLSASSGWYLMETGAWNELIELTDVAFAFCEDKTSMTYALLAHVRAVVEVERNRCDQAYKYLDSSMEIIRKNYGENHVEYGNGLNSYGNNILQQMNEGSCEKAISYFQSALSVFESQEEEVSKGLTYFPHANLSCTYRVMSMHEKAIYHAEELRKGAVKCLGEGNHFDATADFYVGNSKFDLGELDEAERYWHRAFDLFYQENETSPSTNAAKLKLSQIELKRGAIDKAISMLREVVMVAQLNKSHKGDNGEVARAKRRLAEAYEMGGDENEARKLKAEAEAMRMGIQGSRFKDLPDTDLNYAIMAFHAFW